MSVKDELSGWKEIAAYIGRSVRTAQRWERELDLPVRRIRTPGGEAVYALTSELDAWKNSVRRTEAGQAALEAGEHGDSAGPPREDPPPPPAGRGRIGLTTVASTLALAAAVVWMALHVVFPTHVASARTTPPTVLDQGPWPTGAHDMRRTNQSPLQGPVAPVEATFLYSTPSAENPIVDMVSTLDGTLVFGECGHLLALDRVTRSLRWQRDLTTGSENVWPWGFTVDLQGRVLAAGTECPDVPGGLRTGIFVIRPESAEVTLVPQGSAYSGPAIGPDRTVYTLDESTLLRAYEPWFDQKWMTQLAGYSNRGLAIDSRGNLYAGTDGGRMHQSSFWSIRPQDGEVRWRALRGDLGLPAIDDANNVYVASRAGNVHAFTADGEERWSAAVGSISSDRPLAVGRSGTVYVHATTSLVALARDGSRKWTFTPGGGTNEATPVLDGDEHVYAAFGNAVYCLSPRDGRVRWRVPLEEPGVIILGQAGTLYAVSARHHIFALTTARPGAAAR